MERCPCCHARLNALDVCPRCHADLTVLNNTEQMAQLWLNKAIQYWLNYKIERSLAALDLSLHLKNTRMGFVFQAFIIQQQCEKMLELLAQKKPLLAKQLLFQLRHLIPINQQLQQLSLFADYLTIQKMV